MNTNTMLTIPVHCDNETQFQVKVESVKRSVEHSVKQAVEGGREHKSVRVTFQNKKATIHLNGTPLFRYAWKPTIATI